MRRSLPPSAALRRWLEPATSSLETWRKQGPFDPKYAAHDQLSQLTTRHRLENLTTHSFVHARVQRGDVQLHAWWFDIQVGRMLAYSAAHGGYVPAVEALASLEGLESEKDVA